MNKTKSKTKYTIDLTQRPPRSPRVQLGGYVLLPRIIDKGRAALAGKLGEFHYAGKGMDRHFFNFTGLNHTALQKQIARGLYPAGLEEHGLVAAVEELVEAARRAHPALIDFRASPDFRLPGTDRALQVYRIIQEALTNALRHSRSERIEVRLSREESRSPVLVAEVTDHGEGLPPAISGDGMGLRIMRYRAETAGAELRIEKLDPGTRVTCRIDCGRGESL